MINRHERFLIVGENGVGKSTLLKLIIGKLSPIKGNISYGIKTDIAYYAQELEMFNIYSIGRYGAWTYCSMEDCMIKAKELAKQLN